MFSATYLCMCLYCIIQLVYLLVMNNRRLKEHSIREHYFSILLILPVFSFIADIMSTMNHVSDGIFPFAAAGNYLEIILNTLMIPVYFLYVCTQITDIDWGFRNKVKWILWILTIICSGIVISTVFTEKIFYFDIDKNYHRGSLFWVPMSILFIMMLIVEIFIVYHRKKIEEVYLKTLVAFLCMPIIGWGLQLFIYGLPFSLISITFAAQVVFTNIQNRSMDMDYLTGVFNRKALDHHIQNQMNTKMRKHTFSAIMMDIDNFKCINDTYGHAEGDQALIQLVTIVKEVIGQKGFMGRYGGDEFCIILQNDDQDILIDTVKKIREALNQFNQLAQRPYLLESSMGYGIYRKDEKEVFLKRLDQYMYDDKSKRKERNH